MPCFKGLAVSIHAGDGAISEHGIQKLSRQSRISSYIPVPPAQVPPKSTTGKPEQSTFAISITLLTPGLNVPYSQPKPTPDDPYPRARVVGGLPGFGSDRGRYNNNSIPPYVPRTTNPNETIAAYIYFDGRAKEEVATLLRRGEETWVNSRWVSVPESEGGGLAEREFLFREVGLERWLNGLDLEGSTKEKADCIERRQQKLEKKRRKRKEKLGEMDSDDDDNQEHGSLRRSQGNGVLKYGGEGSSPVEDIAQDEGLFSTDSDSDDDAPQSEAAGQIKVALFRVLASGEIKRGEYSPQFDAHDDDEGMENGGDGGDGDVDHTTSFAKPKTLDPKTISTQTVTGLDPPESPYAVFTFFYRGEKQLRKMGIIPASETQQTPQSSRRKSSGTDFAKLGPLKSAGTVGFSGYRDPANSKRKSKAKDSDAMDSDADDEDDGHRIPEEKEELDAQEQNGHSMLSPEDARRTGEIADGVQKIKLKRQHSADPIGEHASTRRSPNFKTDEISPVGTPASVNSTAVNAGTPPDGLSPSNTQFDAGDAVASPFKRHRASMTGLNSGNTSSLSPLGDPSYEAFLPATSLSSTKTDEQQRAASAPDVKADLGDSDEEL